MITVIIDKPADEPIKKARSVQCIEQCLFDALALKKPYPFADFYFKNNALNQQLLCLSPLSLAVGMRDVFLQAMPKALDISDNERKQMVELLAPLMSDVGLIFIQDKSNFYLKINRSISTTPYFNLLQKPIKESLPKGKEHSFWNRLFSECQMALSQAPFNLLRQQEGKPPINALWFWGEGKWFFSDKSLTVVTDNMFLSSKISSSPATTLLSTAAFLQMKVKKNPDPMVIYLSEMTELLEKKIRQLNRKHSIRRIWRNGECTLPRQTMLSRLFTKKDKSYE